MPPRWYVAFYEREVTLDELAEALAELEPVVTPDALVIAEGKPHEHRIEIYDQISAMIEVAEQSEQAQLLALMHCKYALEVSIADADGARAEQVTQHYVAELLQDFLRGWMVADNRLMFPEADRRPPVPPKCSS